MTYYLIALRLLRGYYNEVCEVMQEGNRNIEAELILLDEKWASKIVGSISHTKPVAQRLNMYTEGFKDGLKKAEENK